MRLRFVWVAVDCFKCILTKSGLSIKEHHCFETHLNRIRDFGGSRLRMSMMISQGIIGNWIWESGEGAIGGDGGGDEGCSKGKANHVTCESFWFGGNACNRLAANPRLRFWDGSIYYFKATNTRANRLSVPDCFIWS